MTESIVTQNGITIAVNISQLLEQWVEAERSGVEFPVPFDMAWPMAGFTTKGNAKRDGLKTLKKGRQFLSELMKNPRGGRSSELIMLSLDGFKHFCLMADTQEGEAIRDYFIESERKWKLVQQVAPNLASEIDVLDRRVELAKWEAKKAIAEAKALAIRDYAAKYLPQPVADRVLGVTEIKITEIKEVVVNERGQILGHKPGESCNKRELCERYGLLTKTGKPDYRQINAYLDGLKLPGDAWEDRQVVSHNPQLKVEYLPRLDELLGKSDRQQWIGE